MREHFALIYTESFKKLKKKNDNKLPQSGLRENVFHYKYFCPIK